MVLCSVEDSDEDTDHAFGVGAVGWRGWRGGRRGDKESTGEVAHGGYYHREVVTTVPEAVVRGLIAENLMSCGLGGMRIGIPEGGETDEHETDDN